MDPESAERKRLERSLKHWGSFLHLSCTISKQILAIVTVQLLGEVLSTHGRS